MALSSKNGVATLVSFWAGRSGKVRFFGACLTGSNCEVTFIAARGTGSLETLGTPDGWRVLEGGGSILARMLRREEQQHCVYWSSHDSIVHGPTEYGVDKDATMQHLILKCLFQSGLGYHSR